VHPELICGSLGTQGSVLEIAVQSSWVHQKISVRHHAKFREDGSNRCRNMAIFGRPFVKWFALCYRTVVCPVLSSLSVCNIGVL